MGGTDAEFDDFEATLNVAFGVGDGFAVLARQRFSQLVHVPVDQTDSFHHHPRPALGVGGSPFDLGNSRRGNSSVKLVFAGERHAGLDFAGGRVENIGKTTGRAFDVLAVDEMGKFLHRTLLQKTGLNIGLHFCL